MKCVRIALIAFIAASPAAAKTDCIDRVDMSKASGIDTAKLAAAICGASVMAAVLDSATIRDSFFGSGGENLIVTHIADIKAGKMTDAQIMSRSAKLVDIEFRAGGVLTLSFPKLRAKIERYMAETYIALFDQQVPLRRVRIAALYPLKAGKRGVVYGTSVSNDKGRYGPGSRPPSWKVWRLNPSLRKQ